jgi:hypothetical protein
VTLDSNVQLSTAQHSTAQHSTAQHSMQDWIYLQHHEEGMRTATAVAQL